MRKRLLSGLLVLAVLLSFASTPALAADPNDDPLAEAFWGMDEGSFDLIQWTWGAPVNLVGGALWCYFNSLGYRQQRYEYAYVTEVPFLPGNFSLGLFIFERGNPNAEGDAWLYARTAHEYGHSWQALVLGPLYWFVVALPSLVWAGLVYPQSDEPYDSFYTESWATQWGLLSFESK